jgi:UDP-GlcNAc:undecaprenyl-phosphate GlcNAc-1-phosphate transferase
MIIYLTFFCIAFILTLIFIPIAKRLSLNYNLHDDPENDSLKVHKVPISFLGGGAMFFALLLTLMTAWVFKKNGFLDFETPKLMAIFIGSTISWFYGFWDDTRWQPRLKISQGAKIFFQMPIILTLALILYIVQIRWQFFITPIIGILASFFYLIFITNAINIQDGLDGLLGGLVLISSCGFFVISLLTNNILGLILSSIIIGNNLAFLFFNWCPASIFMGNNGSYLLGFLMAVFVIMNTRPGDFVWLFGPLLILGMPLFNAGYVFLRRFIHHQPLFSADRHHFYDETYRIFGSVPKSVLVNYLIHAIFVAAGLIILTKFL